MRCALSFSGSARGADHVRFGLFSAPFVSPKPMRHTLPLGLIGLSVVVLLSAAAALPAADEPAADGPAYDLTPRLKPGDVAEMATTLEVGGELLVPGDKGGETKVPLSVVAKHSFVE